MSLPTLAALLTLAGPAQVPEAEAAGHAAMLARRVVDGRVDYRGLADQDVGALDAYLARVATAALPANRDAQVAFLVDAYNALVIRAVIRHGRPRSVLDVKGFFDRDTHRVAGREVTLDQLERSVRVPVEDQVIEQPADPSAAGESDWDNERRQLRLAGGA